ncbi:nicotianamine aminotransferase A-like [Triticum dicoccoides]|uniref:nicotianamine aminotransferase A-like n=1 Tax=Triticum dicoccoides TaxID=85692 RepID=UPI00188E1D89|nr:nicotianamine aminotransferase A-like [Triticum dicoccoides]
MATVHQSNGHGEAAAANGKSNGHAAANGKSNGHGEAAAANGNSNGHAAANGKSNGHGEAAAANGKSNGHAAAVADWNFAGGKDGILARTGAKNSIRAIRYKISASVEESGPRPVLPLAHGDPSVFPAFRTAVEAEDAVAAALRTGQFSCYAAGVGLPAARSAVAEHLSQGVPYKLSADDIFLTAGGTQAIEVIIPVLAQTVGANILLPRPGYPNYEARAAFNKLEVRHFDLIPEKGWEIDIDSLESIADKNTTAMLIINPNNPCGSVYSYEHLAKVAEVARKLGILVIADEVYGKLVLGSAPFIPMGVFGHIAPVLSIGSLSKSWIVPGWRLGWVAMYDPTKILEETKVSTSITNYLNVSTDPATFVQAALPQILENTKEDFFKRIIGLLKESSEICYREIKENKYITCPHKPEGSMFVMVKLNLHLLEEIHDDIDFCCKLAKQESVILCPGSVLGMENWVRITFACVPSSLEDGLERIKSFCQRNKKKNSINGC